jgi:hypothetical protein
MNLVVEGAGVVGLGNSLALAVTTRAVTVGKNLRSFVLVVLCIHAHSVVHSCCKVNRLEIKRKGQKAPSKWFPNQLWLYYLVPRATLFSLSNQCLGIHRSMVCGTNLSWSHNGPTCLRKVVDLLFNRVDGPVNQLVFVCFHFSVLEKFRASPIFPSNSFSRMESKISKRLACSSGLPQGSVSPAL